MSKESIKEAIEELRKSTVPEGRPILLSVVNPPTISIEAMQSAMAQAQEKRSQDLDSAFTDPDKRRALVRREAARILAQYLCRGTYVAAATRKVNRDGGYLPEMTPPEVDGFAEWMALNDPAFHAAVDVLAHLVEEYVEAGKRLHVRIAERWLYPERETDTQVAAGKTAEAIAARISATQ